MKYDYTEFNKLVDELQKRGHRTEVKTSFDGLQCIVDNSWDFIIHRGSYGHEDGRLEVFGMSYLEEGNVEGFLTCDDVLDRLDRPDATKKNGDGDVFDSLIRALFE